MSLGLTGAIMATIVFIVFIVVVGGVLPHSYNQGLKSEATHSDYCTTLKQTIDQDRQNIQLQNLTIQEINTYAEHCSS